MSSLGYSDQTIVVTSECTFLLPSDYHRRDLSLPASRLRRDHLASAAKHIEQTEGFWSRVVALQTRRVLQGKQYLPTSQR